MITLMILQCKYHCVNHKMQLSILYNMFIKSLACKMLKMIKMLGMIIC